MSESRNVEYCVLRYVPNVLSDKIASIAAIFIDSSDLENGICTMILAPNWRIEAQLLDPDADLEMLEALLTEVRDRLHSKQQRGEMIRELEDSFSNIVQVSQRWKCPVIASRENIEAFARRLLGKKWEMPPNRSSRINERRAQPYGDELETVR
jgi:DUF3037 family protein